MTQATAQLAREMVRADGFLAEATSRGAWHQAQIWQECRDRLADQRFQELRREWADREQKAGEP